MRTLVLIIGIAAITIVAHNLGVSLDWGTCLTVWAVIAWGGIVDNWPRRS